MGLALPDGVGADGVEYLFGEGEPDILREIAASFLQDGCGNRRAIEGDGDQACMRILVVDGIST